MLQSIASPEPIETADYDLMLSLRQERILGLAREQGFVSVDELSRNFNVTPQTIRRDVNRLCDRGLLRRYHGGAGIAGQDAAESEAASREAEAVDQLARAVAREIPNRASLFILSRSHGPAIARALLRHEGLRIVTNDLEVAHALSSNPDCEVIVAGGLVRGGRSVTGETTIGFFRQFRMDIGLIGVGGVDTDGTLLENDFLDVETTRTIMANSRSVFLVAEKERFGTRALVRFGNISEVDILFTNEPLGSPYASLLAASGIQCRIADGEEEAP